ncbi:arsenate reductase family protein [Alicyclobacillus sp. SO9]|uniref:arsenate reductase family protein n=1 Tax=Alicyclobacillus sp. SO9 TaxID=2665646 RepID=UPI0018E74A2F|nr:Spx/MgsR family RNA polymerase-binding regulatory protein [Alicyclobacillus sp. SO9]QQE80365.1 Spx/MgsR family RNA polymerase-binding regulatory protein [Alicyclobacillus sp. SO9]
MEFYGYKKCSTCRKAFKDLEEKGIETEFQDFVKTPPTKEQLREWAKRVDGGIEALANPRGTRYRELGLKGKSLTEEEWLDLLSQDGKLLRRPLLIGDDFFVVGYDQTAYAHIGKKA